VSALVLPPGKIIMGSRRLRSNRHGFSLIIERSLSSLKRDVERGKSIERCARVIYWTVNGE
jgi:hypothetical protein